MSTLGSKLVTNQMQWHANMTDQNHLGAALLAKPARLESKMKTLFSAQNYYSDNPISSLLMNNAKTDKEIAGTEWEWQLKGASTRPLVILENVEPSANTTPGKFKQEFRIKLDENWFLPGDVIAPGTANKKFQIRIQTPAERHGDGWLYRVKMMTDDANLSFPVQYLAPGTQFGKLFAKYEEGAEQSGSTQFSMPLQLKNKLSKYRKQYMITDYASTEVLAVAMEDNKGGRHNSWMRYADVEYWMQWYREIEKSYWYSRSTNSVNGSTGRAVQSGPGIQEQLEDSHIHKYSTLTGTLIEDYLMDIFYSRVKPGAGRSIKGYTGEYGMIQFHRAVQNMASKSAFLTLVDTNANFLSKEKSPYHSNALGYGYQFTKYRMANGIELELIHNPLYDDREINMEIDPISGYPVESQRITFLDFAGEGGESNIQLMSKKDSFFLNYVCGNYGPLGPQSGKTFGSAHAGDYYEMHVGKSCGVHIEDITKCGELILARG